MNTLIATLPSFLSPLTQSHSLIHTHTLYVAVTLSLANSNDALQANMREF